LAVPLAVSQPGVARRSALPAGPWKALRPARSWWTSRRTFPAVPGCVSPASARS